MTLLMVGLIAGLMAGLVAELMAALNPLRFEADDFMLPLL
jgi:hypothetical protein